MKSVEEFLAYAIKLEEEATLRFGQLADAMLGFGNKDVGSPDLESPEAAAIWAADPFLAKNEALEIALASETAGYEFYKSVHDGSDDPEIRVLAAEFVAEEAEHVKWIEQWIDEERNKGGPSEATLKGVVVSG